jgi:AraC-like DNA-binding protein
LVPTDLDPMLVRHYCAVGGRHAHDHAQVLFGLEGTLHMDVEGRASWIDATCGLVVPAGMTHSYRAERFARVLVLDCEPCRATERSRSFALAPGWRTRALDCDALLDGLVGVPSLSARRRIDLDALAERIDSDLASPWTVANLAAACRLSPQRLRARFAEALGVSPMAFVRARRLDAAVRLMQQGLSLDAAAMQVGYASASALSACLRRERDVGARQLRKRRAFRAS